MSETEKADIVERLRSLASSLRNLAPIAGVPKPRDEDRFIIADAGLCLLPALVKLAAYTVRS